jgi:anti-sigma B factor antagonist
MTVQRSCHPLLTTSPAPDWSPAPDSPAPGSPAPDSSSAVDSSVVSITGFDGTVIATVSRELKSRDALPPYAVVAVDGDIDRDTAPVVEQALLRAIDDSRLACLDVHEVGFFGAAGVHMLVTAMRHAATLGHTLRLEGVHGITERVLAVAGLDLVVPTVR